MDSSKPKDMLKPITSVTDVVDDAVGMEESHWFIAVVNNNSERKTAERLQEKKMNGAYECYVPTQRKERVWKNGRKNFVDEILLPALLFIRCTKEMQREAKRNHYVFGFLKDSASSDRGYYEAAIIPDSQVKRFRDLLENSDKPVSVENTHFKLGDRVKVKVGSLSGLEGNVIREPNATYLVIRIETLGYAKVQIDPNEVEKLED